MERSITIQYHNSILSIIRAKIGDYFILNMGLDSLKWYINKSGKYTRASRKTLRSLPEKIVLPKIKPFMWLVFHKRILTWNNLQKREFKEPGICVHFATQMLNLLIIWWELITCHGQIGNESASNLNKSLPWIETSMNGLINSIWNFKHMILLTLVNKLIVGSFCFQMRQKNV